MVVDLIEDTYYGDKLSKAGLAQVQDVKVYFSRW